jgi:hypothetical protein
MSPLAEHEFDNRLLDRFVVVLTEELNLNLKAGGTTTLRRRRKKRGIEADNCYWIVSEPKIRGKRRIHLKADPPPDLAVEVDVTSSSLDRLSINAVLKVPEVWRLDSGSIVFHILGADGNYAAGDSLPFPGLKATTWCPSCKCKRRQTTIPLSGTFDCGCGNASPKTGNSRIFTKKITTGTFP